jgi:hypothetical protein
MPAPHKTLTHKNLKLSPKTRPLNITENNGKKINLPSNITVTHDI